MFDGVYLDIYFRHAALVTVRAAIAINIGLQRLF
jgi:hypothetical protein